MDLLGHELLESASAVGVFMRRNDQLQHFVNAHRGSLVRGSARSKRLQWSSGGIGRGQPGA